ncbi:voltage-gated chloride channel family protein [Massilia sp. 9096]|uniref:voltage-gated chloride channel family protein n=1 Tax=Massilia sp. 9096 TaxID=1500894 RepID=UPI0005646F0D|nr:voltage-gated chloride channel family protein [Massilia sp. 9096]
MKNTPYPEQVELLPYMGKWLILAIVAAVLAGSASAFFLSALDRVTEVRIAAPRIIWLLPLAGFAVGWVYDRFGKSVEAGNNLIIDEIHDPRQTIPLRMAPLVLGGTIISHLFGASVGREGTAVQMGATLSDQVSYILRLDRESRRVLVMAGMSAGFAAVFGTPVAGAIFGLEVLAIGRMRYDAILPCIVAAIVADRVGLWWGIQHTHYILSTIPAVDAAGLAGVIAAGIAFGLAGMLFAKLTHRMGDLAKRHVSYGPLRPLLGGSVVALAVYLLGTQRYIGLGIPVIVQSFQQQLGFGDAIGKLVFTVVSLGTGFKGGEVTPLFYIGATLGNALAPLLHLPFPLLAGLGFVAVFAGAANVPLASTVMAIELFGGNIAPYAALACVVSYLFSGHTGIYRAQRIGRAKHHRDLPDGLRLSELPAYRARSRTHRASVLPKE